MTEEDTGNISDGYHTFDELYEFRKLYNAALFNEWANDLYILFNGDKITKNCYYPHKSYRYNDGELCFGGDYFIVCAELPTGLISNHYKIEDWDLFDIPSFEKCLFPYDGHTPQDVMDRLRLFVLGEK